ncbi:MAG: hypothetical protein CL484_06470 [Acidobacteria bacterium]|nr:hypothetical protein [Acidobacteriota bacterium]
MTPQCRPVRSGNIARCFLLSVVTLSLGYLGVSVFGSTQEVISFNRIIEHLKSQQAVIGTFTRFPMSDLDFLVIDTQYTNFDIEAIRRTMSRLRASNEPPSFTPIVRIPDLGRNTPQGLVAQLLDAGVTGIMFPNIETADQARTAIGSMRFQTANQTQPEGLRHTTVGSAPTYWSITDDDYRRTADVWPLNPSGQLVALLQIESLRAVEQLDEILAVPGIGVIFLGPTDLASSIGTDNANDPQVEVLVQQVLRACLATGIPCGYPIVATSLEMARLQTTRRLNEGFSVLAVMTVSP